MKSLMCRAFGEPNSLSIEETEPASPGHGQIRIGVKMASINFFDILMIQGKYQRKPPFPFTVGTDAAGDVLEIGPGIFHPIRSK